MNTENSIVIHSQSGRVIPISRRDAAGNEIDISTKVFTFKTQSGLSVNCTTDPDNAKGLLLTLSEANIASIGAGNSTKFALIDTTSAPDEVLWYGTITVVGW